MRNPFAVLYRWCKRIWAPNPFVVLLRNAQTDLAIRIWTILGPIRLKKKKKNGFGPFSYTFFVPIRVGLTKFLVPNKKNGFGSFSYKFFVSIRVGFSLWETKTTVKDEKMKFPSRIFCKRRAMGPKTRKFCPTENAIFCGRLFSSAHLQKFG